MTANKTQKAEPTLAKMKADMNAALDCWKTVNESGDEVAAETAWGEYEAKEKAFLSAPARTVADIALKAEHIAGDEGLGQYASERMGLLCGDLERVGSTDKPRSLQEPGAHGKAA